MKTVLRAVLIQTLALVLCSCRSEPTEIASEPEPTATPIVIVIVVPTATRTPTATPTNTPTPTPSPTSARTPLPRPMSREQFEYFMFGDRREGVETLYEAGWHLLDHGFGLYDGEPWSDAFPCPADTCIIRYLSDVEQVVWDAYDLNNDANYWCAWLSSGVAQRFSSPALPAASFYNWKELVGSPDDVVYCPQFAGEWEAFESNATVPIFTEVPDESYGWSRELRWELIQKYVVPIIDGGWLGFPHLYGSPWYGVPNSLSTLSDSQICYAMADGHYFWGFPEYRPDYEPRGPETHYYFDLRALRMELRQKLVSELAEPVDGNPPLCPHFLDMIAPYNLP